MNHTFESQAEKEAYPYLLKISKFLKYELLCQYEITDWDYCKWVKEKITDLLGEVDEEKATELEERGYRVTNRFVKYRLDFALIKGSTKIDIEIDGDQFHIENEYSWNKDNERDNYLTDRGWDIIRIRARDVFKGSIKKRLEEYFRINLDTGQVLL